MRRIVHWIINFFIMLIIVAAGVFFIGMCLGYEPRIVLSGSMEPVIQTGSLAIVNKNVAYDEIHRGDIIAYEMENGAMVLHRVITKTDAGYETKGDNAEFSDGISTTIDNYYGKEIMHIPYLGYFMTNFQTVYGKVFGMGFIVLLLLFSYLTDKDEKADTENQIESGV